MYILLAPPPLLIEGYPPGNEPGYSRCCADAGAATRTKLTRSGAIAFMLNLRSSQISWGGLSAPDRYQSECKHQGSLHRTILHQVR